MLMPSRWRKNVDLTAGLNLTLAPKKSVLVMPSRVQRRQVYWQQIARVEVVVQTHRPITIPFCGAPSRPKVTVYVSMRAGPKGSAVKLGLIGIDDGLIGRWRFASPFTRIVRRFGRIDAC